MHCYSQAATVDRCYSWPLQLLGEPRFHYFVIFFPAAERVGAELLDLAAREGEEVVIGRLKFRESCKERGKTNSDTING